MTEKNLNQTFYSLSNQFIPDPTIPKIVENPGVSFVSYGVDNLYPQSTIIPLYQSSAMNRSCISSKWNAMVGEGLKTEDPNAEGQLEFANPMESWGDIYSRAALDFEIFGGFALNIIWNKTGDKINSIYNLAFEDIRSGHIDHETDKVEYYYYSADWKRYKKAQFKPKAFKAFDPAAADIHPNQILYCFKPEPGNKYYGLPDYAGSLTDINLDVLISTFHWSNLQNGLFPGLLISLNNGIPDPQSRQEIYEGIASAFSGTQNAGKFFLNFANSKENSMEVTPIESANDAYYTVLDERISSRILTGHKITSPLLLGIKDSGAGFSSTADEITVAYTHFTSTVIQPDQKFMLKILDKIFYYAGGTSKLYVEPKRIFNEEGQKIGDSKIDATN